MIDFRNYLINGFLQGQIYALLALGFMLGVPASRLARLYGRPSPVPSPEEL